MVEPLETISNQISARRAPTVGGIKMVKEPDVDNRNEGLEVQKLQAEKDLIEALRQAR
jgi:hypothetical protein